MLRLSLILFHRPVLADCIHSVQLLNELSINDVIRLTCHSAWVKIQISDLHQARMVREEREVWKKAKRRMRGIEKKKKAWIGKPIQVVPAAPSEARALRRVVMWWLRWGWGGEAVAKGETSLMTTFGEVVSVAVVRLWRPGHRSPLKVVSFRLKFQAMSRAFQQSFFCFITGGAWYTFFSSIRAIL